jgi:hypothetical protein
MKKSTVLNLSLQLVFPGRHGRCTEVEAGARAGAGAGAGAGAERWWHLHLLFYRKHIRDNIVIQLIVVAHYRFSRKSRS